MRMNQYRGVHSQSPQVRNQRSKVCFLQMFGAFVGIAVLGLIIDLIAFHDRNERFAYRVINPNFQSDYISADLLYLGSLESYLKGNNPIIKNLQLRITKDSEEEITVRITDSKTERFEVAQLNEDRLQGKKVGWSDGWGDFAISLEDENKNFNLKIIRESTGEEIFHFDDIEFIFTNRFIQIGTTLASPYLWGLGQRTTKTFEYQNGCYTLWNKHQQPGLIDDGKIGKQGSGFHPVYLRKQKNNGFWHVMFIQTSNGLTFSYNELDNITFTLTGGIVSLKFFIGDSPAEVIQLYHKFIGNYVVPPFWATGFHISKSGYNDSNSLIDVWTKFNNASIPLQAIWSDLGYQNRGEAFSIDTVRYQISNLKEGMLNQSQEYIRWVPSMALTISQKQNISQYYILNNLLVKSGNYKSEVVGCGDFGTVLYPDYNKLDTWNALKNNIAKMKTIYDIDFDGMWLFGSEMYNSYTGEIPPGKKTCNSSVDKNEQFSYDNLPYNIMDVGINNWSINTNALYYHGDNATVIKKSGSEDLTDYNFHNLNAFASIKAVSEAVSNTTIDNINPLVMAKSTIFGSGRHGGHFIDDNKSTFEYLRLSLVNIFNFQLFGIPFTGVSVCGAYGKADPELCARWMALGSMYPFAMNYNADQSSQEPYAYGNYPYVLQASRRSLQLRYSLLKYYYSEYANNLGVGTVFNPLFINFPDDEECLSNDRQAMIGPALLITPVLEPSPTPNTSKITPYFPEGAWYSLIHDDLRFLGPGEHSFNVPFEQPCPTFLREGYVVVYQSIYAPGTNKTITRTRQLTNNFNLAVALSDGNYYASGYVVGIKDYNDYSEECTKERNDCVIDINCTGTLSPTNILELEIMFESNYLDLNLTLVEIDVYMRDFQIARVKTNIAVNHTHLNNTILIQMEKQGPQEMIS